MANPQPSAETCRVVQNFPNCETAEAPTSPAVIWLRRSDRPATTCHQPPEEFLSGLLVVGHGFTVGAHTFQQFTIVSICQLRVDLTFPLMGCKADVGTRRAPEAVPLPGSSWDGESLSLHGSGDSPSPAPLSILRPSCERRSSDDAVSSPKFVTPLASGRPQCAQLYPETSVILAVLVPAEDRYWSVGDGSPPPSATKKGTPAHRAPPIWLRRRPPALSR